MDVLETDVQAERAVQRMRKGGTQKQPKNKKRKRKRGEGVKDEQEDDDENVDLTQLQDGDITD